MRIKVAFISLLFFSFTACSSVVGQRESIRLSDPRWKNFEEVKKSFEEVKMGLENGGHITLSQLKEIGFSPEDKNVTIIYYLDLERYLLGNDEKKSRTDLPERVQECLAKKEKCWGFSVNIERTYTKGKESFYRRFFKGEKKNLETGWRFTGFFILEIREAGAVVVHAIARDPQPNKYNESNSKDPRKLPENLISPILKIPMSLF